MKLPRLIAVVTLMLLQTGCAGPSSVQERDRRAREACSPPLDAVVYAKCYQTEFNNKGFFERWGDNIRESKRQEELRAQEAQRQEAIKRQQDAIALQNQIQNQCRGYGFQMGTPAMANCVMQVDLAHKQLQQQQQQADAAYNQKVQQCRSMWGQGMGQPTMSGSFGESLGNANTAYQNCMAGVPTAPTQVICNRSPNPQVNYVYCTTR